MSVGLAQVKDVYAKALVELADGNPDIFVVEADLQFQLIRPDGGEPGPEREEYRPGEEGELSKGRMLDP